MSGGRGVAVAALLLAAWAPLARAAPPAEAGVEEALWQHRNLGKAFYENPATQLQAVEEFAKALALAPESARERVNYGLALLRAGKVEPGIAELERAQQQDPRIPHTFFNLGIAYKQKNEVEKAIRQFEGLLERVPDEPVSCYNLGVLHKLRGEAETSLAYFEKAARLAPDLAGPHFQLASSYRQAGRLDEAQREMEIFRQNKERRSSAATAEDLEWSWYAEIFEELEPPAAAPVPRPELRFVARRFGPALGHGTRLFTTELDGDGAPELLAYSPSAGLRAFAPGPGAARVTGLEGLRELRAVAPADFDNDGLTDLAVVLAGRVLLARNNNGQWAELPGFEARGDFRQALWLDFDHDYDLDLFLFGRDQALWRNQGAAGFAEFTPSFPFLAGEVVAAASLAPLPDTPGVDLVVALADQPGIVYRDLLGGKFSAERLRGLPAGSRELAVADLDHDGDFDLLAAAPSGVVLLRNSGRRAFEAAALAPGARGPLALFDLASRGDWELYAGSWWIPAGGGAFAKMPRPPALLDGAAALAAADFDGDGRVDLVTASPAGQLTLHRNHTAGGAALRLTLVGVKNAKLALGAEVEIKAGRHYQKLLYPGFELVAGVGSARAIDTVRITWPNGLIQNETRQQPGARRRITEAQRLSGSCPMVFSWNGSGFEFITDVLGVAPLGAASGDGEYFPVDHDEAVLIPGRALRERDGFFEVRLTEELREVTYLDEVRLLAVDRPRAVTLLTNEKFKSPPFPEFRLFAATDRVNPLAARDDQGDDVLAALLARDAIYPDRFPRRFDGTAARHRLELEFAPSALAAHPLLVLSGWVDWADGSTFLAAAQAGEGLEMPSLSARGGDGTWQRVVADLGLPAGKPKTMVVDLAGKLPPGTSALRLETGLAIYWDEIYLSREELPSPLRLRPLPPAAAELRFRGFSRVVVHPERRQPERFLYDEVKPTSNWNPTPGLYTRYGQVSSLIGAIDDQLLIFGSGDELRLLFAANLEPPPPGYERDYLLLVDGWAKDGDANTAYGQSVEPLPYHLMPQYPYHAPAAFPADEEHRRWRELYNVRPALRLIRPLRELGEPASKSTVSLDATDKR